MYLNQKGKTWLCKDVPLMARDPIDRDYSYKITPRFVIGVLRHIKIDVRYGHYIFDAQFVSRDDLLECGVVERHTNNDFTVSFKFDNCELHKMLAGLYQI